MNRLCNGCGAEIPMARIKALPLTSTCVGCSTEEPVGGVMDHAAKNDAALIIYDTPEVARRHSRRGFHAQIGANSYDNPRLVKAVQAAPRNLSAELAEPAYEGTKVNTLASRCHPEKPRVNPRGDCLDCALAWYKKRK